TAPELEFFEEVKASQEEYAEALIFQTLLKEESYLTPEEVGVEPSRYLMGLGDVPGELRREVLTALKKGDIETAEELLDLMEDIYFNLVTCE
ncbi:MAG: translin family protein, partial [Candidatus Thorarchaeota archaeon]|nr:translin family protein [Candidatus Thorarchaeota archaeon]